MGSRVVSFATDAIDVAASSGVPFTLKHGLGRQVRGWLVIWSDAAVSLFVPDPSADTRASLTLTPSATCNLRLVLL